MKLARFNLRDLFWLVLVAAMGCGWWVERRKTDALARELHEATGRARFVTIGED